MTTDKLQLFPSSGFAGGRINIPCVRTYCGNILGSLFHDWPVDKSISKSASSQTRSISETIRISGPMYTVMYEIEREKMHGQWQRPIKSKKNELQKQKIWPILYGGSDTPLCQIIQADRLLFHFSSVHFLSPFTFIKQKIFKSAIQLMQCNW